MIKIGFWVMFVILFVILCVWFCNPVCGPDRSDVKLKSAYDSEFSGIEVEDYCPVIRHEYDFFIDRDDYFGVFRIAGDRLYFAGDILHPVTQVDDHVLGYRRLPVSDDVQLRREPVALLYRGVGGEDIAAVELLEGDVFESQSDSVAFCGVVAVGVVSLD